MSKVVKKKNAASGNDATKRKKQKPMLADENIEPSFLERTAGDDSSLHDKSMDKRRPSFGTPGSKTKKKSAISDDDYQSMSSFIDQELAKALADDPSQSIKGKKNKKSLAPKVKPSDLPPLVLDTSKIDISGLEPLPNDKPNRSRTFTSKNKTPEHTKNKTPERTKNKTPERTKNKTPEHKKSKLPHSHDSDHSSIDEAVDMNAELVKKIALSGKKNTPKPAKEKASSADVVREQPAAKSPTKSAVSDKPKNKLAKDKKQKKSARPSDDDLNQVLLANSKLHADLVEDIGELSEPSEDEDEKIEKDDMPDLTQSSSDDDEEEHEQQEGADTDKGYKKFDFSTATERTVFVGNVPLYVKAQSMKKLFTPYGNVEAIYKRSLLQKTDKLTKKMFGTDKDLKEVVKDAHIYVRFEKEEDAKKATELNGTIFKTRYLRVTLSSDNSTDPQRSLLVGNLLFVASEQSLMKFFMEKIGNVESVRIVHDKATGLGKGYGFVTFKSEDQVPKALAELQGEKFKGRPIRLSKIIKKKKNRPVVGQSTQNLQQLKTQRDEQNLKKRLTNYVVTKKTLSSSSNSGKLSKKVAKTIRKRKQSKPKSLLS